MEEEEEEKLLACGRTGGRTTDNRRGCECGWVGGLGAKGTEVMEEAPPKNRPGSLQFYSQAIVVFSKAVLDR